MSSESFRARALLTRAQSREVDARLVAAGVPGVVLMENAGRGAAEHIAKIASERDAARVVVLAGPGNNGGDGYVAARHLALAGMQVDVLSLGDPGALRGDAAIMRDAWRAVGGAIGNLASETAWADDERALIVDGLFGTGLSRALSGDARAAVERLNARRFPAVVALDVPSGLDADTGAALGDEAGVVRASHTLTFGTSKPGLHTGTGRRVTGEVSVIALGAPVPDALLAVADVQLVERARVDARAGDSHKGDHGHVLVLGGSEGRTGAALLTARGAHRAGAGLVTIASRASAAIDAKVTETMSLALAGDSARDGASLASALSRFDAVVVGPGLGRDGWALAVLDVVLASDRPLVIDADALALLAGRTARASNAPTVLTPHPLEMARLMDEPGGAKAVNDDRLGFARRASARFAATVVLKGAGTVIASPSRPTAIAPFAEPLLGIAGSGDVLAGVIAARLAERGPRDAARATIESVMAHGRAGEILRADRRASRGALASEIADAVGLALEHPEG